MMEVDRTRSLALPSIAMLSVAKQLLIRAAASRAGATETFTISEGDAIVTYRIGESIEEISRTTLSLKDAVSQVLSELASGSVKSISLVSPALNAPSIAEAIESASVFLKNTTAFADEVKHTGLPIEESALSREERLRAMQSEVATQAAAIATYTPSAELPGPVLARATSLAAQLKTIVTEAADVAFKLARASELVTTPQLAEAVDKILSRWQEATVAAKLLDKTRSST